MTDQEPVEQALPATRQDLERQILLESLTFLYRSLPSAALGHSVAGGFVVYALYDVVSPERLFIWLFSIMFVAFARIGMTSFVERRMIDAEIKDIENWATWLLIMTFVQTSIWGSSVFFIWPDELPQRALLIVTLAGIIAAGGVMLALHRRSFVIYCLPIALPAAFQLVMTGGRLEYTLAGLLLVYSIILLVSINRLTGVFLEGLRLRFLMQNESRTDALTELTNRRGFDESLHDLWQQSIRSGQSIGILILDVDYFKNYNDYYGHPQGDVALKKLGQLLEKVASRSTDLCARIGGEEFAVIMPTTDLGGCRRVAEAIRAELAEARIPHRNSNHGFLTVSIGLNVKIPGRSDAVDHFIMEADMALYDAKESGRNCLAVAKSVTGTPPQEL